MSSTSLSAPSVTTASNVRVITIMRFARDAADSIGDIDRQKVDIDGKSIIIIRKK